MDFGQWNSHLASSILMPMLYCLLALKIDYMVALTLYKTLLKNQPGYIRSLLSIHHPARLFRSSDNGVFLYIPYCKTATASRAFSHYAPLIWNSLSKPVRDCISESAPSASLEHFKKLLKTFLYHSFPY